MFDKRPVLEEALHVALAANLPKRAAIYANALIADAPEHAHALAALALAEEDPLRAAELSERALASSDDVETRLAAAEVARKNGQPAAAMSSLHRAAQLAPADSRPRTRLADLYHAEANDAETPSDIYTLLHRAHRHFARTRELAELHVEAGRLVEVLDRPLLVTVMGEFNSGKSTFVNALLGEEVAPMGITPTTATINILKYGTERRGRVVYKDDTARDVAWKDVPALLRGLDAAEAQRIRVVEVLYPLETLQRVNVVDTPGLNSIHPEHEATARRFNGVADAVVWLFTVDQAAKATEGEALTKIRGEGKKILGVLNKIDRCTPEELERIQIHVKEALGEHLETVVPFAAKAALTARKSGDIAALQQSNYPLLAAALEERFFSKARAIQRDACRVRLRALIEQAATLSGALLDPAQLDAARAAIAQVRGDALLFSRELLEAERRRLALAVDEVYTACAREVLDFVRPRRWPFGSNQAAPADRDFLLNLLDERLGAILHASRERVAAEAQRSFQVARAIDPTLDAGIELELLDEQVYTRFRAFARGFLRGGRVDDFFTRVLPKLELTERDIRRALERDAPWSDDIAEAELRVPLRAWGERFFAQLIARLERARAVAELERLDVEERVLAPVERISRRAGVGVMSLIHDELILGIDEAGRGPILGPMVMACVALRPRKASALTRAGVTDSKKFAGENAHALRLELVPRILDASDHFAVAVVDVAEIDRRCRLNQLNKLEQERAEQFIRRAPTCRRVVCDGARLFGPLRARFSHLEALDNGELQHAAVAAASILAKTRRDEIWAKIRRRYAPEFGHLVERGGGYTNAATHAFLRAYIKRHKSLPPEGAPQAGRGISPSDLLPRNFDRWRDVPDDRSAARPAQNAGFSSLASAFAGAPKKPPSPSPSRRAAGSLLLGPHRGSFLLADRSGRCSSTTALFNTCLPAFSSCSSLPPLPEGAWSACAGSARRAAARPARSCTSDAAAPAAGTASPPRRSGRWPHTPAPAS